jgi:prolipoprotein diacylglyceryltransferase
MIPRHPVQLYEAFSYLMLLFILITLYRKVTPAFATKILPGIFLTFMFIMRFLLEYTKTRQADYTTSLPFTTGQLLSIPFILIGLIWIIWAFTSHRKESA